MIGAEYRSLKASANGAVGIASLPTPQRDPYHGRCVEPRTSREPGRESFNLMVVGEAGLGKTTLLESFFKSFRDEDATSALFERKETQKVIETRRLLEDAGTRRDIAERAMKAAAETGKYKEAKECEDEIARLSREMASLSEELKVLRAADEKRRAGRAAARATRPLLLVGLPPAAPHLHARLGLGGPETHVGLLRHNLAVHQIRARLGHAKLHRLLARALPSSPSSPFGGRLIPRSRPASWGQRAPSRIAEDADARRGDDLTAGVKAGDDGAGYDSGEEAQRRRTRDAQKKKRTNTQRARAMGKSSDPSPNSLAGYMSIGSADVDPTSFGVSSTDGDTMPAFKPIGYSRPALRRRSVKGNRVWKILAGVARPNSSSNVAASDVSDEENDVSDNNTAVMDDAAIAGGVVMGGGVMGSGDFEGIAAMPIGGISVDDPMEADEDPYYPFEESVRPTEPVSVNGINGISGGSMDNTTNGRTKKKKKGTVVSPPKPYKVMRINSESATENPGTQTEQQLTRRALLRDAELTPRDLRRIDPSLLQTNNTPALLVNDQTILVNLGVRVIIRPDHALLFEPDTATARRFLAAVEQRQKNSRREQGLRVSDRSLAYDDGPIRGIELENGHEISGVGSGGSGGSTDADASVDKKSDYDLDETPEIGRAHV